MISTWWRAAVSGLFILCVVVAPALGGATSLERARQLVAAMSFGDKITLVRSQFAMPSARRPQPKEAIGTAGLVPALPRLSIPALQEGDGALGVANPTNAPFDATAMPSGLALAASFDPRLAERAGAAIGSEARDRGLSVLLAGAADLTRDPRGGRDFEYAGEDPLLTGSIVGAEIAGIQSRRIISTLKHYALNDQENGRVVLNAELAPAAARESDLLAFELALERGRPGAVMTSYNRVDGAYAAQNAWLISELLKREWGFAGWVMSDWSGTHSTVAAAEAGLDQESGVTVGGESFFGEKLAQAVEAGRVPMARLDDMVIRQLGARGAAGLLNEPPPPGRPRDLAAHADVAQEIAARGIVLLKNNGVLPLTPAKQRILVVGGHADIGVLSGGGSSQVVPAGSIRFPGEPTGAFWGKPRLYDPSPPVTALQAAMPGSRITFFDGLDPAAAAMAAREADTVIVFAEQWRNESRDADDLTLPDGQNALIDRLAAANPRTIVVLETGGPVTMPWLGAVAGVLEAWYPGSRGGRAIADILTGRADPAGRLPMTFPAREAQLPRPRGTDPATTTSNPDQPIKGGPLTIDYNTEGPDVGYKWFLRTRQKPLFPFGYGLSYTRFAVAHLTASNDLATAFDVKNAGAAQGTDVAELYLDGPGFVRRLAGFAAIRLAPGETRRVVLHIDPRLAARWDEARHGWHIAAGRYTLSARPDAISDGPRVDVILPERDWPAGQNTYQLTHPNGYQP